ncbi:hypothetical protein SAMN05428975_1441 [Mucilaginibacter sp. OK268]|jgi:hypothetical protein|uniref:lipoprotein n=1 Tax=Mucilaginibacter sp. OK268 TaxID=1881048 RepID=UPI000882BC51|nr:lipoprotein [Mucilaginibacter sp. OK268]SDP49077.1 hypothetical protein SAMN05428975_1441 [Mucilaginibacter sp. OK268]
MKRYIIFIGGFAMLTGCVTQRQHKLEHAALDSVVMLNAAGATTDSIYSLKNKSCKK